MSPDVLRLILAVMLAALLGGCDYVMPPKTVEDCLLRNLKPGLSIEASEIIADACRSKFDQADPGVAVKLEPLEPASIALLHGRAGLSNGSFSGSIYNGNPNWSVREIVIGITEKHGMKRQRAYATSANIGPLSSGSIYFSAGAEVGDVDWQILSAKGERVKK